MSNTKKVQEGTSIHPGEEPEGKCQSLEEDHSYRQKNIKVYKYPNT